MMLPLASSFAEAAAVGESLFGGLIDSLKGFDLANFDFSSLGVGGVAAVLALVWYFVRIVRAVVGILFILCLLLLVLHLTGYADIPTLWEMVSQWLGQGQPQAQ